MQGPECKDENKVGDMCLAFFQIHGRDKDVVQFTVSINDKHSSNSVHRFNMSQSELKRPHTPNLNPNSIKILKEAGIDLKKPF